MKQLYLNKSKFWAYVLAFVFSSASLMAQTHFYEDAVTSGTIWHSDGSEVSNPISDQVNSSSTVIMNSGNNAWERTELFPDAYTIQSGDKLYISFYNPNNAASYQLKMSLSTAGTDTYIGDFNHNSAAASGWHESEIDLSSYEGQDISKIMLYPTHQEAKSIYYDNIYIKNPSGSQSGGSSTTITNLFGDAVVSGTIWHSNGAEVSNPKSDRRNQSSVVIQNNGAGAWEETQLFPDTYTIQTGDKLFISFYNPNDATSWQLKMSLSTDGADKYIGDFNHEAPASGGWYESVIDISNYSGQDISKITIYPAGGEAKSIYYDALYISNHSSSGETSLFRENTVLGYWNSDGGIVTNPSADAINYSDQVIVNNGSSGWKDTQWFPNYLIQSNDRFFISFYNPNGAAAWQLRMDLSSSGAFTWIGEPAHDTNSSSGWAEVSLDLNAYAGETISKIQLYSSAGEAIAIYFDNIYFSASSHQSNYWVGTSSTDWSASGNWEGNFTPTSMSNVTIQSSDNKPQIGTDVTINHLTLQDNLTISSGTLTVNGNVDGSSGGIMVNSGASLITKGTITGTTHQVKRTTTFNQSTGKYSAVGSPVADATTASLGSLVYKYDEAIAFGSDGNNRFSKVNTAETMAAGNGYFSAFSGELTFTGTPNTGDINVSLVYNESNDGGSANAGFNLVSNPYPCAIDYSTFVNANNDINAAIYLWDDGGSDIGQRSNSDYITINELGVAGGGSTRSGDWNGHIGAAQGFFVKATTAGTLTFTDAQKVPGNNADANYFRKTEEKSSFKILISGNDQSFESLIGFVSDATHGIDRLYDAPLLGSPDVSLTSLIEDNPFTIQGLPSLSGEQNIPLNLTIAQKGTYAIALGQISGLSSWNIYLKDKLNNKTVLLNDVNTYEFQSEVGKFNSRFELTVTQSILGTENLAKNPIQMEWNSDGLRLFKTNTSTSKSLVQIADISGKTLLEAEVIWQDQMTTVKYPFEKHKIYLVKVKTSENTYSSKFLIH